MIDVLIVDDAKLITDRLAAMLEDVKGIRQVAVSHTLQDTRPLITKYVYNVAILDILLPDGSGIDIIPLLQAQKQPACKIIMMTDDLSTTTRTLCEKKGADYVLNKFQEFECIPHILSAHIIAPH